MQADGTEAGGQTKPKVRQDVALLKRLPNLALMPADAMSCVSSRPSCNCHKQRSGALYLGQVFCRFAPPQNDEEEEKKWIQMKEREVQEARLRDARQQSAKQMREKEASCRCFPSYPFPPGVLPLPWPFLPWTAWKHRGSHTAAVHAMTARCDMLSAAHSPPSC